MILDTDNDGRVRLSGRLDMQSVGALVAPLVQQAALYPVLTVDLSAVQEADSAALALLLNTRRAAQDKDHIIKIEAWPQSLQSLLPLYGLDGSLCNGAGEKQ